MHNEINLSSALIALDNYRRGYKVEHGTITVGDIEGLIDNIDFIIACVKKQKAIPTNDKKYYKMFGKMEWIKCCRTCDSIVDISNGQFCSKCGQKFC